ncbi:hypothetical protein NDU88_004167 [Pleurodeles waltl]|uniref:Uncharacterized protein n=1 Tax=Pleurodeles waltl TaxID=8319 RepID=A0AAV7WUR6_PLEWA|nr:hypothetical protein NDU88_004167 [Pleurodeles waltl]
MCRRSATLPVSHYDHSTACKSQVTRATSHTTSLAPRLADTTPDECTMSTSPDSTQRTGHNMDGVASVALSSPPNAMCRPAIHGVSFLCPPEPLALVSGRGVGLRWQNWLKDFEDFMKRSQFTDPAQQLIVLRNLIGKEVGQIIKELPTDTASSYQGVRNALNRKFLHKRNIDYEQYSINLKSQERD